MKIGFAIGFTPIFKVSVVSLSIGTSIPDYLMEIVHESRMVFSANCVEIHPGRRNSHLRVVGGKDPADTPGVSKIFASVLSYNKAQKQPLLQTSFEPSKCEIARFTRFGLTCDT